MESKVNYAAVGLFVIVFGILGIGIALWIMGGKSGSEAYKEYVICTDLSVNGLSPQAPVKYKGLYVGKVLNISISRKNPNYLLIHILLKKDFPITTHLVAHVSSNGLTGISYINLVNSRETYKCPRELKIKYPCIPTVASGLNAVFSQLPKTIKDINEVTLRVSSLLDNKTQSDVKTLLANLVDISKKLSISVSKLNTFLENANFLTYKVRSDAGMLANTVNNVNLLINNLNKSLRNLNNSTFKESYSTLKEIKSTTIQMKQLIMELRQNPSLIIKGRK